MARKKKGLFDKLRKGVRSGLNSVQDRVQKFERRGGMRGAFERARVRGERQAEKLKDMLEDRGINIEFGRWVPETQQERDQLARHYRTLGVPRDASFETVKAAYRAKMREHHPDKHASDADAERRATRISQDLTMAYDAIEAHFRRRGLR